MTVKAVRRGLNQETLALLGYIRRARPVNLAHGLSTQVAIAKAHMTVDRILKAAGIEHSVAEGLRWMVEDVARALCDGEGEVLAFELNGVLAKWLRYDLEPNSTQLLLRVVLKDVAGISVPEEQPESGIRRQSAERASGEKVIKGSRDQVVK